MAVYLPDQNALFVHAPKTGGMFVTSILEGLGVPVEHVGYKHSHKDLVGPLRWKRRPFTFTFVRHPVTWYASYWEMKMRWPVNENRHWYYLGPEQLWQPNWEIDPQYGSDEFAEWIRRVTTRVDYLHDMYRAYTGLGTPDPVDFIGKQEHLTDGLAHVLQSIGVDVDPVQLQHAERVNYASSGPTATWTPQLRDLVLKSERRVLTDYGYDEHGPLSGPNGRPEPRTRPIIHAPLYTSRAAASKAPSNSGSGSRIKQAAARVLGRR